VALLEESGAREKALEVLNNKANKIVRFPLLLYEKSSVMCIRLSVNITSQVDKLGLKEVRASLLLNLNHLEEAEEAYYTLLDINPENYKYSRLLLSFARHKPVSCFLWRLIIVRLNIHTPETRNEKCGVDWRHGIVSLE
jgi:hypothetical protein